MAPYIEEKFGQVEVPFFSSNPVQLDQADLNLLVARPVLYFSQAKIPVNKVGTFQGDLQDLLFSRCLVIRGGRLIKVSQIIEFVAQVVDQFPPLTAGPGVTVFPIMVRLV